MIKILSVFQSLKICKFNNLTLSLPWNQNPDSVVNGLTSLFKNSDEKGYKGRVKGWLSLVSTWQSATGTLKPEAAKDLGHSATGTILPEFTRTHLWEISKPPFSRTSFWAPLKSQLAQPCGVLYLCFPSPHMHPLDLDNHVAIFLCC